MTCSAGSIQEVPLTELILPDCHKIEPDALAAALEPHLHESTLAHIPHIRLHYCPVARLYHCPVARLYAYMTIRLYNYTTIRLHDYTTILHIRSDDGLDYTTIQVSTCLAASTSALSSIQ